MASNVFNLSRVLIVLFICKTISFSCMVHYRLSRSVDSKTLTWTQLDDSPLGVNTDDYYNNVTVATCNGTYQIDNCPTSLDIFGEPFSPQVTFRHEFKFWAIWRHHCECYHGSRPGSYFYNPITKDWIQSRKIIIRDIEQWILDQPPQLDQFQKAYEKDRVSVEQTFVEIENSIE